MIDTDSTYQKSRISDIFKNLMFKRQFYADNPTYFEADGLCCFTGPQGSGKTLSAVNYVYNLMQRFPKSKLVTNLQLKDYPIVTFEDYLKNNYTKQLLNFYKAGKITAGMKERIENEYLSLNRVFPFNDDSDFKRYGNLDEGVIYLVDEIQLYLNSLESKNINMEVLTEIAQQRKQRKHIVCTSQVFGRMGKAVREQFSVVCKCRCFFKLIQFNQFLRQEDIEMNDGAMEVSGKPYLRRLWIHSPRYYGRYDTYYKIEKGKFVSREKGENEVYERADQVVNITNGQRP